MLRSERQPSEAFLIKKQLSWLDLLTVHKRSNKLLRQTDHEDFGAKKHTANKSMLRFI